MFSPLLQTNPYSTVYQTTKILDWSKLKAFADDKINVTEKLKFVLERAENIVEKEKTVVASIFFFSHKILRRLKKGCGKSNCVAKSEIVVCKYFMIRRV